eukprot:gene6655-7969_t
MREPFNARYVQSAGLPTGRLERVDPTALNSFSRRVGDLNARRSSSKTPAVDPFDNFEEWKQANAAPPSRIQQYLWDLIAFLHKWKMALLCSLVSLLLCAVISLAWIRHEAHTHVAYGRDRVRNWPPQMEVDRKTRAAKVHHAEKLLRKSIARANLSAPPQWIQSYQQTLHSHFHMETYQEARQRCQWRTKSIPEGARSLSYSYYESDRKYHYFYPEKQLKWEKRKFTSDFAQDIGFSFCDVRPFARAKAASSTSPPLDDEKASLESWRIMRFGPLQMTGGTDWHEIYGYSTHARSRTDPRARKYFVRRRRCPSSACGVLKSYRLARPAWVQDS